MLRRTIAASLIAAHLSGCASMLAGGPSMLDVEIEAPNDTVTTTLVAKGSGQRTTVTGRRFKANLDRGNDYEVTVEAPGLRTEIRDIRRNLQGVYWLNILFFLPGLVIDLATGAAFEHTPTSLRMALRSGSFQATAATTPVVPVASQPTATRIGLNPTGKVRIAILDFQDIDTERSIGRAAAENLRNALIERQRFIVVERAQIQQALQEQFFTQSGMVDSGQAVTIGKLLGAKIIVVGSVTKLGRTYTINARFIDVQTGEAKDARSQKTDSEDNLAAAVDNLAGLLE